MRTQDHLRQAAATIRQAAIACKQECDEIRRLLGLLDQQRRDRFNSLKNEERQRFVLANTTDSDESRARNESRARLLRGEEAQVEHDFARDKKMLDDELQVKQRLIDELNAMAHTLDNYGAQVATNRPRL